MILGYDWYEWLTFFYIYCFFGWVWESCYVSCLQKHWVNRGFLRLPLLPLYGSGAVIMLAVSRMIQQGIVVQFFVGAIAATILEYATGWGMEKLFKMRYWDYSDQKMNLNGYICFTSTIAWGIFTVVMNEVVHPPISAFVMGKFDLRLQLPMLACMSVVFFADTMRSARAAVDMGRAIEAMTRIRQEAEELQVQLVLLKDEVTQRLEEKKDALIGEKLQNIQKRMDELNIRKETLKSGISGVQMRLLKRNPSAISRRFEIGFKEIRERIEQMK